MIRSKWKKNKARGLVHHALQPREVVQMDTIWTRFEHDLDMIDFGRVFAFTAVDIFSREADVFLAPELTSEQGRVFLEACMTRRFTPGFVELAQTDGGPEFKGAFAQAVGGYCNRHRVSASLQEERAGFYREFQPYGAERAFGLDNVQAKRHSAPEPADRGVLESPPPPPPLPPPTPGL